MFKHNGTKNMQPFIHNVSKNIFLSMKGSFVSFIPNHPENSKWDKSEFFVLPAHRFPSEQFFFYKTSHYQTCAKQTIDHKKYMMGHQSRRWLQVSVLFLHKKQLLVRIMPLVIRLLMVRMRSLHASQAKKEILGGVFAFQIIFAGKTDLVVLLWLAM